MTALPVLSSQTEPRIPDNHCKRGRLGAFRAFLFLWSCQITKREEHHKDQKTRNPIRLNGSRMVFLMVFLPGSLTTWLCSWVWHDVADCIFRESPGIARERLSWFDGLRRFDLCLLEVRPRGRPGSRARRVRERGPRDGPGSNCQPPGRRACPGKPRSLWIRSEYRVEECLLEPGGCGLERGT